MNCSSCPFKNTAPEPPEAEEKKFTVDDVITTAKMRPYSDAFFEITEGKHKGSLVHIWDIIK